MNKIRRLIRWFIPFGYAFKKIKKYSCGRGELKYYKGVIPIQTIYETPHNGFYIVYSQEEYNNEIQREITKLECTIKNLRSLIK